MPEMNDEEKLEELERKCNALESSAGITEDVERAREGRFIPLGAFGEDVSPDEYFADEYDYIRRKIRDAYFSVKDIELRKELIKLRREIEKYHQESYQGDINLAHKEIDKAKLNGRKLPWETAALLGVASVALGYWLFDIVGALAGAVGGFFIGQGTISDARSIAETELEQATNELKQAENDQKLMRLRPDCFSLEEELAGERDERIDRESAYANILQSQNG
jgi:hypothetical protein